MITKTLQYEDLNGDKREEVAHFHMTKAELMLLEVGGVQGDTLTETLKRIVVTKDNTKLVGYFTQIIDGAYGRKTEDGRFVKRADYLEEFKSSEAYSELVMNLLSVEGYASEFVNGIMPADVQKQVAERDRAEATPNGFRPGAQTLPQSRRDALAQEQAAAEARQAPQSYPADPPAEPNHEWTGPGQN